MLLHPGIKDALSKGQFNRTIKTKTTKLITYASLNTHRYRKSVHWLALHMEGSSTSYDKCSLHRRYAGPFK